MTIGHNDRTCVEMSRDDDGLDLPLCVAVTVLRAYVCCWPAGSRNKKFALPLFNVKSHQEKIKLEPNY